MVDAPDATDDSRDADTERESDVNAANESEAGSAVQSDADSTVDSDPDAAVEALRREVEEKYDFDDFGPADMAQMSAEEWEAAFDADTWTTGGELLDRVAADLRSRIATRDVFAVLERTKPPNERLVAYSDTSYAIVHPDGTVEGEGTVLEDVKPSVALASMPEYEVPDAPEDASLPSPESIETDTSDLGNLVLQTLTVVLVVAAFALFGAALFGSLGSAGIIAFLGGFVFLGLAAVLIFTVANARLSSRYRAEEYRERLRAAGVEQGERPDFLPISDDEFENPPAGELETEPLDDESDSA